MKPLDYANHFGHSLQVAHKHYIGYGLVTDKTALEALDHGQLLKKPDTKPDT
jgi:hypothetical protein